ncbi:ABC transporter ATP-binding protein [Hornefia butyriciproducens]|uniref:ABC transporter ATP-binding protein n=1 Tax=Hornefia butyriciproducens TaxID=2652293 RepID=UPI0029F707E0|nr:ABC transporter ATP-binding protein [Hornefia butyriciproducens]MDD7020159.1 ABC transporter ATP-binding protein [Hornefia butyriciproducens]MDY5462820.1 ABC transporter ATP-binding protein [Hornefia butyriciproducens]
MEDNNTKTAISFRHVTKTYKLYKDDKQRFRAIFFKNVKCKQRKAINDVSFDVMPREAVALFGRNGAGKSTLLKMITQVTYPSSGEVEVNGRVSALLELTAGFDPEFTGRENIYFRGNLLGLKEEDVRELEPQIIEFAELGDYMDQPVRTYSSGMKARLGFAINVSIHPEILIVDEALSVGDKSFRKKCKEKIRELVEDENVTFLFVTHSTAVAEEFCTRGLVMKKGKLIFDGEISEAAAFYDEMIEREDAEKAERRRKKRERRLAEKRALEKKETL